MTTTPMTIPVPDRTTYHYGWLKGEGPRVHDQLGNRPVVVTRIDVTSYPDSSEPTIDVNGLKLTTSGRVDARQAYDLPVYDPDFEAEFLKAWKAKHR